MSGIRRVLIYGGRGICHESVRGIRQTFKRLALPWRVEEFVVRGGRMEPDPCGWERATTLFVLPGGRCSEWDRELGQVVGKIRECVTGGDCLLGICAGSYFASRESTYRWSEKETGHYRRGLGLFEGRAEGPLFFHAESVSSCGVSWEPKTVVQRWEDGSEVPVLVLGGPHYVVEGEGVRVLARIVDGEREVNAVVKSVCGLGTAILMNWCPGVTIDPQELGVYQRHFPLFRWEGIVQTVGVEEERLKNFERIVSEFFK